MTNRLYKPKGHWALAGLLLVGAGACSTADEEYEQDLAVIAEANLDPSEAKEVEQIASELRLHRARNRVRPILECVEKVGHGKYVAHFGFENTAPKLVKIPVGNDNWFFPPPLDREQLFKGAAVIIRKHGPDAVRDYCDVNNGESIDGLPGLSRFGGEVTEEQRALWGHEGRKL